MPRELYIHPCGTELSPDSQHKPNMCLLNESLLVRLLHCCEICKVDPFRVRERVHLLSQVMGRSESLVSAPVEAIRTL